VRREIQVYGSKRRCHLKRMRKTPGRWGCRGKKAAWRLYLYNNRHTHPFGSVYGIVNKLHIIFGRLGESGNKPLIVRVLEVASLEKTKVLDCALYGQKDWGILGKASWYPIANHT